MGHVRVGDLVCAACTARRQRRRGRGRGAAVRRRGAAGRGSRVEAALEPFEALIEAGDTDAARLKPLGQLLLHAATEVKFAAGASGLKRAEGEWQPTADEHARLWHEAPALLDVACRIGIPAAAHDIVNTLASFIDVDPRGVLARLIVVLSVAERFGFQGDSLAETSFNELVAALLSRHRDIVLRDPASRAHLLEALSSFARAGSSSARRTLLGLDDLLR